MNTTPASMSLSFGGHVLDEGNILTKNIPVEEPAVVTQVEERFPASTETVLPRELRLL